MFIVVLAAMLPAAFIACFTICAVVVFTPELGTGSANEGVAKGFFWGLMGGAVVLAVMISIAIWLYRAGREKPRTWTDVDGRTLEATRAWSDEKDVLLRLRDGKEVKVQIDRLCEADREWMKERG
jgi:hypothetical protein